MNNYSFGNYICSLREKKGLSQSELGEKLGVSNKAVSKWENGGAYPSTELMLPLAEVLGVTIEELYRAVTESKKEKAKLHLVMEWIAAHAKLLTLILLPIALVPLLLYAIFMEAGEEKSTVLFAAAFGSVVFYIGMRFALAWTLKNPWVSEKTADFTCAFFMVGILFGNLNLLVGFVLDFPAAYSPTITISLTAIIAIVRLLQKRYGT